MCRSGSRYPVSAKFSFLCDPLICRGMLDRGECMASVTSAWLLSCIRVFTVSAVLEVVLNRLGLRNAQAVLSLDVSPSFIKRIQCLKVCQQDVYRNIAPAACFSLQKPCPVNESYNYRRIFTAQTKTGTQRSRRAGPSVTSWTASTPLQSAALLTCSPLRVRRLSLCQHLSSPGP
jgi:hypothetical protein